MTKAEYIFEKVAVSKEIAAQTIINRMARLSKEHMQVLKQVPKEDRHFIRNFATQISGNPSAISEQAPKLQEFFEGALKRWPKSLTDTFMSRGEAQAKAFQQISNIEKMRPGTVNTAMDMHNAKYVNRPKRQFTSQARELMNQIVNS
jgi:hypothetical protein